jgi:putative transposase
MNTKRKFSSELKAQIVLSVITKEATAIESSKKHDIAPSLIYKWRDEFLEKAHTAFEVNKEDQVMDRKLKHYEHVIAKITTQNDFLEKVLAVTK